MFVTYKLTYSLDYRKWDDQLLQFALNSLTDELVLDPTVPGGMPDYRLSLALSFFYKFYLSVLQQYNPEMIPPSQASATKVIIFYYFNYFTLSEAIL